MNPVERISSEITIFATAEKVWETVADVERLPGVNPLMLSARWLDGAREAQLGARFRSQNLHDGLGVWTATSTIVALVPHKLIMWTVESRSAPAMVCRFDLITAAERQTILRQTYVIDTRPGAEPPLTQALRPFDAGGRAS